MVSVLAILAIRNESRHILRCLRDLCANGIDVALIDNGSTDDSVEKARTFLNQGLVSIRNLEWRGHFSLREQLAAKTEIVQSAKHDWVIHVDADEWLCPPESYSSLLDAIAAVNAAGYSCINFNEFVFIPVDKEDFSQTDYTMHMQTYYFFAPSHPRLMRAWKRSSNLGSEETGGHILRGEGLRLCPTDFMLRHYIILSEADGRRKYAGRRYSASELAVGWHRNRVALTTKDFSLPASGNAYLRRLPSPASQAFDISCPATKHFWEWEVGASTSDDLVR